MMHSLRALSVRNYRLYAAGALVSNLGTWIQRIGQDWLVLQLTDNSGVAVGVTTGLQFLPALLFSPMAGVVADRVPKRRLLQCTQLMMGIPSLLLGVLAVTGAAQAWQVYVIAFVFGLGAALDAPARQSFVPELVDERLLTNAVALNSVSFNGARMVGPALAGGLISVLGGGATAAGWAILINAVSYGPVIVALQRLDPSRLRTNRRPGRQRGQIREGIRYVRSRPDLTLVLFVTMFAATFGINFQLTSALMATEVFHRSAEGFGAIGSMLAIGTLGGAVWATRRTSVDTKVIVVAALCFGVTLVVGGTAPGYVAFLVWTPLIGLCQMTMVTSTQMAVQLLAPPEFRGRVTSLHVLLSQGGAALGAPVIGWIGESFGARWTLFIGGFLVVASSALGALVRRGHKGAPEPVHAGPGPAADRPPAPSGRATGADSAKEA
ncbi:Predicted arabinose efflux permease, MFS family [Streptomyces sp. LamerLS-316]|uniref:MFS transporter n=1 Tax=unclassified Streptomyces TaxID=2593676 RepID=UPI000823D899|nr:MULTISPECIES: MFS transporter [unclassified Streptomyces]MYQ36938.1 MFS transporter [Streptomyces sp. SID4921]SCK51935.1 Predicted arabinose efflux permease, MFS family [Streptomyces sp. LamerLS-316]